MLRQVVALLDQKVSREVAKQCPAVILVLVVSSCAKNFNCYINVEISARLGTVKYLSKYIYKGPDRATMKISSGMQNEIKTHLNGQFIGSYYKRSLTYL